MNLRRYLLIGFLMLIASSCSKETENTIDHGNDDHSQQPLTIEEALFTNPWDILDKSGDYDIFNRIIKYLDQTPKGAVVYINMFGFSYQPIIQAIQRAYHRGVIFKILIDYGNGNNDGNKGTIDNFKELFETPSVIKAVNNDARPSMTAIDHNKYILFSEVALPHGTAKNLVWASSHNFTGGQPKKLQDAVLMTNKELYNAFLHNWNEIAKYADQGMKNFEYSINKIGDSITAFFFPRLENGVWDGKSTIIEQLDKLSDYKKDTICVLMSEMHASVGLEIANKLLDLANDGANVQVITRLEQPQTSVAVEAALAHLKDAGGFVKLIDRSKTGTVHSKTMLIKGVFEGEMQSIILTGSLNYHTNATGSNNNFLLLLKNSALFDDYWDNFMLVKRIF